MKIKYKYERSLIADTPERIAIRYGVDPEELIKDNPDFIPAHIIPLSTPIRLKDIEKEEEKKGEKKEAKKILYRRKRTDAEN